VAKFGQSSWRFPIAERKKLVMLQLRSAAFAELPQAFFEEALKSACAFFWQKMSAAKREAASCVLWHTGPGGGGAIRSQARVSAITLSRWGIIRLAN
jgi:hypothetical protein